MTLSRYIWLVLLVVLLPVAIGLGWVLHRGWIAQEETLLHRLDELTLRQQQLLDHRLESGLAIASRIAQQDWARSLNPRRCSDVQLAQLMALVPGYSNIATLNNQGEVVCSAIALDNAARQRVRQLPDLPGLLQTEKLRVSEPFFAPLSQRWVTAVIHPLFDAQGRKNGQILLLLDLARLPRTQPGADITGAAFWRVVSADGSLILASDPRLQPQRKIMDITGQTFVSKRNLGTVPWRVESGLPAGAIYQVLLQQGWPLMLGMLLAVSIALFCGWLLARYLIDSMQRLTRFVLAVSQGDGGLRVRPQGPQEMVLLGQELNRMLDAVEYSESRYRLLFGASTDGVLVVNRQMDIVAINEHGASMFGYTVDELTGKPVNILLPEGMRQSHQHIASSYVENPVSRSMGHRPTLSGQRKDGSMVRIQITLSPLPSGSAGAVSAIVRDVSEHHQLQERLQWLSQYDPLTHLPNRLLLNDRLGQAVRRAASRQQPLALLLIGLDHFKQLNDAYGHDCGDAVLALTGQRLLALAGEDNTVARVGGDEFAFVVEEHATPHQLSALLKRIRQTLALPVENAGDDVLMVGGSIGVALYPDDADSAAGLLKAVDVALMQAKQYKRGSVSFYSEELRPGYRQTMTLESRLRAAIAADELVPYFQPIVNINSGRIVGAEALVRWPHEGELMAPGTFLPIAEAAGLLPMLEVQTRRKALFTICELAQAGYPVKLSINVSAGEFESPQFESELGALLEETGTSPLGMLLEITESAVLDKPDIALARMTQLQAQGYLLSIDDFGTGYSSLSYLHAFPFDRLKLDRSFVARLPHDERAYKVTAAIITLAHELGLRVVAEGVEQAVQLDILQTMGCDYAQGFYLYRPMSSEAFSHLLMAQSLPVAP